MAQRAMHADEHGELFWNVERLWALAKALPVRKAPIQEFEDVFESRMCFGPKGITFRQLVDHVRAVQQVDLSYPIILAAEGWIMDGRTRLEKALLQGLTEIATVRFPRTPEPDERVVRTGAQPAGAGPAQGGPVPP